MMTEFAVYADNWNATIYTLRPRIDGLQDVAGCRRIGSSLKPISKLPIHVRIARSREPAAAATNGAEHAVLIQ